MVLPARSRIPLSSPLFLPRTAFSISSRSSSSSWRAFHTIRSPASTRTVTAIPLLPGGRRVAALSPNSFTKTGLNTATAVRLLTTSQREKVKVLLVLYDGGKHAEEVSYSFLCSYTSLYAQLGSPEEEETSNFKGRSKLAMC